MSFWVYNNNNIIIVWHVLLAEPSESNKLEAGEETVESELLEFSKFDINRVLKHGERLVGSSGAEYDLPDEDLIGVLSLLSKYCSWNLISNVNVLQLNNKFMSVPIQWIVGNRWLNSSFYSIWSD